MAQRKDFEAALRECPGDLAVRGGYADWLDEQGNPEEAALMRWVGRKVYVAYDESSEGGEIYEGEEDLDYPNYSPTVTSWAATGVTIRTPEHHHDYETVEVDGDVYWKGSVYLVHVRYASDGTFHTHHGQWKILGGYCAEEEANKVAESARDNTHPDRYTWNDFFGGFEGVEVAKWEIN